VFVLFGIYRGKTLRLKEKRHVMAGLRQVAVADTQPGAPEGSLSWAWFLAPAGAAVANAVWALGRYDAIPQVIPLHFNLAGEPDRWGAKSIGVVLLAPLLQLAVTAVFMMAFWAFRSAKRQLSVQRPAASARQYALFRRGWSRLVIVGALLEVGTLSVVDWRMLGFVKLTPGQMAGAVFAPVAAILVYAAVLSVKLGQGGWRAKIAGPESAPGDPNAVRRDDDGYWKAGLFYYNPDDPALWVEKRFGIGYTVNFGRPAAWLLVALPLAAAVAALVAARAPRLDEPAFLRRTAPIVDNLFDALKNGDYDRAVRDFSPPMLAGLDAQKLKAYVEGALAPKVGAFESYTVDRVQRKGRFAIVRCRAKFTGDDAVVVRVVFEPNDPALKIGGLWFDSPKLR
jgi:uncharacterized membrane protein